MRGRPTNDKKDINIKARLNAEMYAHLEKSAKQNGISLSECIRQMIARDMNRGNTSENH